MRILAAGMPIPFDEQTNPASLSQLLPVMILLLFIGMLTNIAIMIAQVQYADDDNDDRLGENAIMVATIAIAFAICLITGMTNNNSPKIDYSAIENHYGVNLIQDTQKNCGSDNKQQCDIPESENDVNPGKKIPVSFVDAKGYNQSGQIIFTDNNHVALWIQRPGKPNLTEYKAMKPVSKHAINIFVDHKKQQTICAIITFTLMATGEIAFLIIKENQIQRPDEYISKADCDYVTNDDQKYQVSIEPQSGMALSVFMFVIAVLSTGAMIYASTVQGFDDYSLVESQYGISDMRNESNMNDRPFNEAMRNGKANDIVSVDFNDRNGTPVKGILGKSDYKLTLWVNQNGRLVEYKD